MVRLIYLRQEQPFCIFLPSYFPFPCQTTNHDLSFRPDCRSSLSFVAFAVDSILGTILRVLVLVGSLRVATIVTLEDLSRMVSISLSISISRRPSADQPSSSSPPVQNPFASAAPSLRYTASTSSRSHSHSRCPSYANSISASQHQHHTFNFSHPGPVPVYSAKRPANDNSSLERLLSGKKKRLSIVQFENGRLKRRMVSTDSGIGAHVVEPFERKKSYGIGGAGNIRMSHGHLCSIISSAD